MKTLEEPLLAFILWREWFRKIGSNRQLDLKVASKHSPNNSSPLRFLTSCSHLYIKKQHAIYY